MEVLERFLSYVTFDTTSDENSEDVPSSAGQRVFGKVLADEMTQLGFADVRQDEYGYVYGILPASEGCESREPIGFISHLDTSPSVSGTGVTPSVLRREGEEIVVSDGTTLLGADDKAGIAEILTACEYLLTHPEVKHRKICLCFTPDEEIGRGADYFNVKAFGAAWGYTVDGGELGEIQYENFNAASAKLTVKGVNIHPGDAKGRMKNAVLLGNEFLSLLPAAEAPAFTEGYDGFYHVCSFTGDESNAEISLLVRDHDSGKFEQRKTFLKSAVDFLNIRHGAGTYTLEIKDSYYNMREKILPYPHILKKAEEAMRRAGIEPQYRPIRGGTDGARLSYEGLPCPNLSTGGLNFHSLTEYIPVRSLEKMVEVLVELMK